MSLHGDVREPKAGQCEAVVLISDAETPHLVLQGRPLKTQTLGRSTCTRDLSGRCLQRLVVNFPQKAEPVALACQITLVRFH